MIRVAGPEVISPPPANHRPAGRRGHADGVHRGRLESGKYFLCLNFRVNIFVFLSLLYLLSTYFDSRSMKYVSNIKWERQVIFARFVRYKNVVRPKYLCETGAVCEKCFYGWQVNHLREKVFLQ